MKKIVLCAIMYCLISAPVYSQIKYAADSSCYIGAFIVNDPTVNGSVDSFEQLTGKKHSMYFNYTSYGTEFPSSWVKDYASRGAAVQIAFEPNSGLSKVEDGAYIRQWARAAHNSGAVIFLRWACEMNGSWVKWYGNPSLYIQKFKLIHDIMKEEAPNVIMVWAPNNIPNDPANPPDNIQAYYPGDDYVDWVGIDFYCVGFSDDGKGTPDKVDPRDKLKVVYDTYSNKKPIMICEWAATHYSTRTTPAQSTTNYAIAAMDSLYLNAKSQFPKLKAICWFSMDSRSTNGNDYCATDDSTVLGNYKKVISSDYFSTAAFRNIPFVEFPGVNQDTVLTTDLAFAPKITCDTKIDSITIFVNGARISSTSVFPASVKFKVQDYADGIYMLKVTAYSNSGFSNFASTEIIVDKARQYSDQIIDDNSTSITYTGVWTASNSQPDRYGVSYHYSAAGDGSARADWKPEFAVAGYYDVYALWSAYSNRASNAPYIINRQGGSDTVIVNQQINGGVWNLLGRYYFNQGKSGDVALTNKANGIVIADAVRFVWAYPVTSVDRKTPEPVFYSLKQNYPNPFNPSTIITFELKERTNVTLKIYNALGREIAVLINQEKPAGTYNVEFNPGKLKKSSTLSSGVYFYVLRAGAFVETKKMILLK
jgi:hypothetical protein